MTLNEIMDELATLQAQILEDAKLVNADQLGLDIRCGTIYVGPDYLATHNRRLLDYYGGFEYVNPECVLPIGTLTVYSIEDSLVQKHHHEAS